MKKMYLFGALLLSGFTVMGQSNLKPYTFGLLKEKVNTNPIQNVHRPSKSNSDDRALNILWTDDFSGTGALTSPNGVWTAEGPEAAYWSMSTATLSPNNYALSMNGRHLAWDSRTPLGSNEPGGFATTPVEGSVLSPIIDMSGTTDAAMEFILNAMFCCNDEPWTVSVSSDSGMTWGAEVPLNLGLGANDNSNDILEPVKFTFNITPYLNAVAADNDEVQIRFTWTGVTPNGAGQTSAHYYWTIDDIVIYEIPDFEVNQNKLWLQDIDANYEVTSFPSNQGSTLTVQAPITNGGLNTPTNLQMEVTVFDASSNTIVAGPVMGGVLSNPPFVGGISDTITFATAIDLSDDNIFPLGEYEVRSVITYDETDEIPENDTLIRTFRITENTVGHVNYDVNPLGDINNFTSGSSKRGAVFILNQDAELHGADFYLESQGGTVVDTEFDVPCAVWIHEFNGNDWVELGYYYYIFTQDKADNWYTFNFHYADENNSDPAPPLELVAGVSYLVSFESLDALPFWYRASLADADNSGRVYVDAQSSWFLSGNEPWVLLNFDGTLDVQDNDGINPSAFVSQNVPNPFNENTLITYNLNQTSKVTLDIYDVTGKVVASFDEGSRDAGQHNITISANQLTDGVYFYNFKAGDYSVTKRMVVNK